MSDPILNTQQITAVQHKEGPLLIIAGAGTGKTTVITERIKHLILHQNISPKNILALTFTEKAAREMQERIDIALPYGYADMWIHTFHAFCDRVLRNEALHIGIATNYQLLTEAQEILFLRNHLFDFTLKYFRPLGNPDKFLQGLLQHFSRLKDEDVSADNYLAFAQQLEKSKGEEITNDYKQQINELANAYDIYEQLKRKENVMDFGDLISNTLLLFRTRKHILQQYQNQFEFLLIDEFQDTNYAQNQLAILLAGEKKNITVVGDDDQAIYRWRGAAISNMMQFTKHFPKTKIVTLTQNYRSSQMILDTAYKVIQNNNPDRLEVKEKINKHLTSTKKANSYPEVSFFYEQSDTLEAEKVIEKIKELHAQGFAYKDFAILIRANDHAQPFIKTLAYNNIPHQFLGPGKLFHQEEIKDLIAYLKVLYNTSNTQSLYRVITMPIFTIPARDISLLLNTSRQQNATLFEVLEQSTSLPLSERGIKEIEKIVVLLKKHLEMVPHQTAGKILYDFLENAGIMKFYLARKTQEDEIRAQNTAKFFERLKQFETHSENASIYAVVDWIDLSMELGESPLASEVDWSENDAVNILTIHSSKGLEFPVVFIVNLVTQRFPSRERSEQIPISEKLIKEILPVGDYHLQEERRLFYVGLTRAREYVFLTAAGNYGEGKRERKISPFVFESLGENIQNPLQNNTLRQIVPEKINEKIITQKDSIKVNYLSYSQIQTFDICPLHYKLRYILHIPTPPSAALSFGNSVHMALKEIYAKVLQGEKVTEEDIPQILESVWITEGYMGKSHIHTAFAGAVEQLKKYMEENFSTKSLPIELEFPFQFSLGKLKVGGRMDRVDKHTNGSLEIIDYKTGRNTHRAKNIQNDLQLSLYALAAKCIPGIDEKTTKDVTVSFHYLESGEKISTKFSNDELKKTSEKILEKAKEIETSDFHCSKSMLCEDCEYAMLCQANL